MGYSDLGSMEYRNGWNSDRWRSTQPGNYQWHYAEHDNGVMLWLTDPGGRGDNWRVKAGTGTGIGGSVNVAGPFSNKRMAEGIIQEIINNETNPDPYDMKYDYGSPV